MLPAQSSQAGCGSASEMPDHRIPSGTQLSFTARPTAMWCYGHSQLSFTSLHPSGHLVVVPSSRSSYTSPFPGCKAVFWSCVPTVMPTPTLYFTTLPLVPVWCHLHTGSTLKSPQCRVAPSSVVRGDRSCEQGCQKEKEVHLSLLVIKHPCITNSLLLKAPEAWNDGIIAWTYAHAHASKHKHPITLMARTFFFFFFRC